MINIFLLDILNEDDTIQEKDLDYEKIIESILQVFDFHNEFEVLEDDIKSTDTIIKLNAKIKQIRCEAIYNLYCYYKFKKNGEVDYSVEIDPITSKYNLRLSDIADLNNLIKDIDEIMNV